MRVFEAWISATARWLLLGLFVLVRCVVSFWAQVRDFIAHLIEKPITVASLHFERDYLPKLPTHVALMIPSGTPLVDLGLLIAWCSTLGIPYITIFDRAGMLVFNLGYNFGDLFKSGCFGFSSLCLSYDRLSLVCKFRTG